MAVQGWQNQSLIKQNGEKKTDALSYFFFSLLESKSGELNCLCKESKPPDLRRCCCLETKMPSTRSSAEIKTLHFLKDCGGSFLLPSQYAAK